MQKKYFEDGFDTAVEECNDHGNTKAFIDDRHALGNASLAIDLMKGELGGVEVLESSNSLLLMAYRALFTVGMRGLMANVGSLAPTNLSGLIIADLKELMISKQRDYGKGNILKFGHVGIMVRVSDKVERLKNLLNSGKTPSHESVEDSYRDLANYAIIGTMLLQGTFKREVRDA